MKQANTVGNIPPIELKKLSQQESNRHKREQDYYIYDFVKYDGDIVMEKLI